MTNTMRQLGSLATAINADAVHIWEEDLLIGRRNASQITALVERSTRLVMLAARKDRTAVHVADVLADLRMRR